jgi:hypothetical protein
MGSAAHYVDLLGLQLHRHLVDELPAHAVVHRTEAEQPADPVQASFEEALTTALQVPLGVRLGEHLSAEARRLRGSRPDARCVFWIDWGTVRLQGEPLEAWLGAWLDVARHALVPACPEDLRVVSFVAVDAPPDQHGRLKNFVEYDPPEGVLQQSLKPLDLVSEEDLRRFLYVPAHSNCPEDLVPAVTRALHRRTGGDFGLLCQEVQAALRDGWDGLGAEGRAMKALRPRLGKG